MGGKRLSGMWLKVTENWSIVLGAVDRYQIPEIWD
jgi:hypothetical protein